MSSDFTTKLSSAGLIYKHYGREVLKNVLQEESEEVIETVYWKLYKVR